MDQVEAAVAAFMALVRVQVQREGLRQLTPSDARLQRVLYADLDVAQRRLLHALVGPEEPWLVAEAAAGVAACALQIAVSVGGLPREDGGP